MYKIVEENGKFIIYVKGEKVESFSTKKEADDYVDEQTAYPEQDKNTGLFILEDNINGSSN